MLFQNIRYALRLLWRSPGFSAIAIFTLALGIGANTAVFSVIDAVMLKPLPYANPDRLLSVWEGRTSRGTMQVDVSHGPTSAVAPANLVDYARETRAFESLAGYAASSMSLTHAGPPEQLIGEAVTWNYLATLGVQPSLGRAFRPEDDRPSATKVVILTDGLWRDHFGADVSILGRSVELNNEPYLVVGVMPQAFEPLTQFSSSTRVVYLVPAAYPDELLAQHGDHEIQVVGRLKPGATISQAQSELDTTVRGLAARFPDSASALVTRASPLSSDIARNVSTSLAVLLGAVALVLLVACVNVANLLIVRAVGQRRDTAIRLAIGASRGQIVVEMLTRGLVLGALGGAAGLLCGIWTRDALIAIAPSSIPRLAGVTLDVDVLAATVGLSLATGLIAGVLPAWQSSRTDPGPSLKSTELSTAGGRSVLRWRGVLMAAEVAAALVLAVAAGLLVRSLATLARVDLGFQTDHVLALNIALPDVRYDTPDKRLAFFERLAVRVQALPGVRNVAFANRFPMRGGWSSSANFEGSQPNDYFVADFQAVNPPYFATLGIPLARGRTISDDDRAGRPASAVVNQAFVQKFLPHVDPIGRRFARSGPRQPMITIVGVVGDIRRGGKTANVQPEVYLAAAQTNVYPVRLADVAVRTAGDPRALVTSLQEAVWTIDPDQPITNVKTLDEVLSASLADRRFNLILLACFAVLAVGLAIVGVYGVVAYAASERTREIGIRIALGAAPEDVVSLVVRGGLVWAIAGVAAGLAGAWGVTRLMAGLLFGITPTDPPTFAAIAAVMVLVSLGASYIPARRAAAVDPVRALRSE
ncbi:MAG TPA: ABC transporter permease [Vicinamibacterales bacterium]|nr:ABC transporter permease [Vicinamibacterales bacterium]